MDERRGELALTWDEVATEAGISVQTIYRAINGTPMRTTTRKGLERALRWESGSVDRILDGGSPVALPEPDPEPDPDDDELTVEELERALAHLRPIVERLERAAAQRRRNKPTGT
jgi:predicted DNA-binding transcriptional regulator AlpA